jgi:hypothetical protein
MTFPMIYCNGDSYSNDNFHPELCGKIYSNRVGELLQGGYVINKAINGASNRRIIRTAVSDLLIERKNNPQQKIIALLGLTFELRSEIWVENPKIAHAPEESNFRSHQFSEQLHWKENLMDGADIETKNPYNLEKKFYKKFSEGRAFFFSPYAERINLLCDLVMLRKFLESQDIKFLIFQATQAEKLESDFLLDQFRDELRDDKRIMDLESFGFCNWAHEQGFVPFDYLDRPTIGHYKSDAHAAFAEQIILPTLKETGQI